MNTKFLITLLGMCLFVSCTYAQSNSIDPSGGDGDPDSRIFGLLGRRRPGGLLGSLLGGLGGGGGGLLGGGGGLLGGGGGGYGGGYPGYGYGGFQGGYGGYPGGFGYGGYPGGFLG